MANVNEALLNDLEKTANHLTGIAASELAYANQIQGNWEFALKTNVSAQNAWKDLRDKASNYLATLSVEQIQGTVDSYLSGIISHATAELDQLKSAYAYLEHKVALQVSFQLPAVPTRAPYQPAGVAQRTPTHAPCLPGSAYDAASGWCVPVTGWSALQPTAGAPVLPTDPTPGVLGKLGITPAAMGVSPETATSLSFVLPPAAGAALGYFAMRSMLGLALGAGGGLLVSLFLQQRTP